MQREGFWMISEGHSREKTFQLSGERQKHHAEVSERAVQVEGKAGARTWRLGHAEGGSPSTTLERG